MKGNKRKIIIAVLEVVLEHATLFVTVLASAYIVVASQITTIHVQTLILWIISILGLIATAIASEKFFKLNRIEKDIVCIKNKVVDQTNGIDHLFSTRKDLVPLEDRLFNAQSIIITGGSLTRLSDEYYAFFEDKLSSGCAIEIIIVKPYTETAHLLCDNIVYETKEHIKYSQKIEESLYRFFALQKQFPGLISIKLTERFPPFSIIASDLGTDTAEMKIEVYSYAVPTRDRLQFNISRQDEHIFNFFVSQINELRGASLEYNTEEYQKYIDSLALEILH